MMHRLACTVAVLSICLGTAAVAGAQHVTLVPDELQDQVVGLYLPRIAVAADGSYALAVEALVRSDSGREVLYVMVQRFAPNGTPVGPTHVFGGESCSGIDIWLFDFMQYPEIRFQPNGTLVVLMQHTGEWQFGGDGVRSSEMTLGGLDVNGQQLDLAPESSECWQRKLIFPGGSRQDRPRLAITPSGDILVTGDGYFDGADLRNVAIRVLDAAGNQLIEQLIPHDDPASQQSFHMNPDVASNGQVVLSTWHECPIVDNQGNANTCDIGAQFASVTAQGLVGIGGNVTVNAGDAPGTLQLYPSAAMNGAGASVIVWADARDGGHGEIYAQRFDASGARVGGNVRVSQGQGIIETRPEVAMLESGRFMVVWTDSTGGRYTARGRTFDVGGGPEGPPFELAPGAAQSGDAAVAADGNDFAYIYLSAGAAGTPEIGSNKQTSLTRAADREQPSDLALRITEFFPNPAGDGVAVAWHAPGAGHTTLRIYDAIGREVARPFDGPRPAGDHALRIETGRLPPGIYLLELRNGAERVARTLVVAR